MAKKQLPYKYEEGPASMVVSRRGFMKVTGILALFIAFGKAVISFFYSKRHDFLTSRQEGLYKDDKIHQRKGLAASQQNPTVKAYYEEFGEYPLSEKSHHLLHTHGYYARWQLGKGEVHHG
ncbi:iron hydrogenase small subunit [Desulfurobacterium atlanticum]|uniref:Ferredoxin hydrogenase small subunit n=1 Tax=Desulfurobacterium atlanticum TaxID=240169 RepID=A0A238ZUW5_9BACT|nr:iron hydrogenase small subunit [Desulfurobacterium atlanticum]SNR87140.1 ferredoxin hydrogenase small subunit [Desulfurobacterium atlanticum]